MKGKKKKIKKWETKLRTGKDMEKLQIHIELRKTSAQLSAVWRDKYIIFHPGECIITLCPVSSALI